jgi:hypothetical protein
MSKIYQKASSVLMYVGLDCREDRKKVSTWLRDVRSSIDKKLSKFDSSAFNSYPWPDPDGPVFKDPQRTSVNRLVRTNWFDRGWVLREVTLAQSGLLFWGKGHYNWNGLMLVLIWAHYRMNSAGSEDLVDKPYFESHLVAYQDRSVASLQMFFTKYRSDPKRLLDYLRYDLRFPDPHSRIYTFLDITIEPLVGLVLVPNYELSPEEVLYNFAKTYIRTTGDTRSSDSVVHFAQAPGSNLPSCAPRWDLIALEVIPMLISRPVVSCPREGTARRPEVGDQATLKVHGAVSESVRFVSEIFSFGMTKPTEVLDLLSSVADYHRYESLSPYSPDLLLNVFVRTLVRSGFQGDHDAWALAERACVQSLNEHRDSPSSFEWDSVTRTRHGCPLYMGSSS